ncbi:RcpC/CpaB family pilus assembly protein [Actinoplanes sp. NPDC026619]|uniref:Flp pilus assembly protein CpaB n=1 Tax=Actinoplanes sp. NPDC026619 TaxID=3155798 RepID=UPI0033F6D063
MRRRIVLLLVAIVLAGFSATAVIAYGNGADERALNGAQGTWVLLATANIPADTTGADIRSRKLVRQVQMPARSVPSGAIGKLDAAFDQLTLNAELQPDQMLMQGQFEHPAPATASPSPTFVLPSGKIAISVDLTIARQVAGNVDTGSQVTIFLTQAVSADSRDQQTTVVVPKTTVIGVGERAQPTSPAPTPTGSASASASPTTNTTADTGLDRWVVTVAVTQAEAEKLVNGYNVGELHLGLLATPTTSPTPGDES